MVQCGSTTDCGVARVQYRISAADLETILTLVRTRTLAQAGERLGVDNSTVFRNLQRIERGLEQRLFERTRTGYEPTELALSMAEHAEQVETQIESARAISQLSPGQISGTVRITTTDTLLHHLVAPALLALEPVHPLIAYELHTGNELARLSRGNVDIAVRATKHPPEHLLGKHLGPIKVALYTSAQCGTPVDYDDVEAGRVRWIGPDDALPNHPSVIWRKQRFPKVTPHYKVGSILTLAEFVALGMGVGVLPLFLAACRSDLKQISGTIDECQTELWLLTHRESRHQRRVSVIYKHLGESVRL